MTKLWLATASGAICAGCVGENADKTNWVQCDAAAGCAQDESCVTGPCASENRDAGKGSSSDGGGVGTGMSLDAGSPNTAPDGGMTGVDSNASCLSPLTAHPAFCGEDVCGNGIIDTCTLCSLTDRGSICSEEPEPCDLTNLGGATCATRGFSSGDLACTSWCGFDERNCISCGAIGGPLLSCHKPCIDAIEPVELALTATENAVGLAWLSENAARDETVAHFARLDNNLALVNESTPLSLGRQPGLMASGLLAVAPSAVGWLVAAWGLDNVIIYPLDENAQLSGTPQVIPGAYHPSFGSRPGGLPLLTWTVQNGIPNNYGTLRAAIIADDATFLTQPVDLFDNSDFETNIAFVGDHYVVAGRSGISVTVTRVNSDGSASGISTTPVGDYTENPEVVPLATGLGIGYDDFRDTLVVKWATLDMNGNLVGGPVLLPEQPPFSSYPYAHFAPTGSGALAILGSPSASLATAVSLELMQLDAAGTVFTTPYTVARSPYGLLGTIVAQGQRAITAWIAEGGYFGGATIELATAQIVSQ